jgi:anti-anti-sigma factor
LFDIRRDDQGTILLTGRLDAVSAPTAREFLAAVAGPARLDFASLEYIASVGLGILIAQQRRLLDAGASFVLTGLSPHLREVFDLAGFADVFEFE